MQTLILGGNGFIGSHLVDSLLEGGHQIKVLDVARDPFRDPIPGVNYFYGRLEEKELLEEALKNVDIVFHLVSTTVPSNSNLNMEYDIRSNLVATVNLLNEMKNQEVKRIVYLSSGGAVYGPPQNEVISESHPLDPISSYGVVKVAIEKYLNLFNQLNGIKSLVLRPSNVYGPRQRFTKKQGVIAHFLYNYFQEKSLAVWGDGSVSKDYIYVKDLVKAMVDGMDQEAEGIFNIGSGVDTSISELISIIEEVTNDKMKVIYEPAKSFDVKNVKLDISKIKSDLQWSAGVNIQEGIKNQYQWMKKIMV